MMQIFGTMNKLAVAPFKHQIPLGVLLGVFVIALLILGQWRLIVDRVDMGEI